MNNIKVKTIYNCRNYIRLFTAKIYTGKMKVEKSIKEKNV